MSDTIKPLKDRVVAVREEVQTKTASGLYIPEAAKEQPVVAKVIAVGPEVTAVAVGDAILYKEYSTTEVKLGTTTHLILKEEDILAVVN